MTEEADRLFHALADTTRRDILRRCIGGEPSVSRLAGGYPMSFAAVQKHVAVLERAGLVAKERRGREQRVRTDARRGRPRARVLDELERAWRGRVERMAGCSRSAVSVVSVEKDYDAHRLVVVAEFAAPIERVWQSGPTRGSSSAGGARRRSRDLQRHDLAPGGDAAYLMTGPDGERHAAGGGSRPSTRRVARLHRRLREGGRIADDDDPVTTFEVRLAEHDGGTRMELRLLFASTDHMDMLERWGAFDVFPLSVAQMDADRRLTTRRPRGGPMRKIKSNFFISLDNVVESPTSGTSPTSTTTWAPRRRRLRGLRRDADGPRAVRGVGGVLAENADQPFGDVINPMKKYVVSSSLVGGLGEHGGGPRGRRRGGSPRSRRRTAATSRCRAARRRAVAAARGAAGRAQPARAPDRGR